MMEKRVILVFSSSHNDCSTRVSQILMSDTCNLFIRTMHVDSTTQQTVCVASWRGSCYHIFFVSQTTRLAGLKAKINCSSQLQLLTGYMLNICDITVLIRNPSILHSYILNERK